MVFIRSKKDGYQLYDFENGLSEKLYDYISNPLNYRTEEGMLFLYLGEKMFRMNEDKSIQLVEIPEYGPIYLDRYSLRGKDLEYFISFYNRWKDLAGSNPEQFMDVETIKKWLLMQRKIKIIRKRFACLNYLLKK